MEGSVADCGRNVGLAETADARPGVRETAHSPIGLRGFSYSPKTPIAQAWIVPDSYRRPTRFLRGRRRRWFSAARSLGGKRGCANPPSGYPRMRSCQVWAFLPSEWTKTAPEPKQSNGF